MFAQTAAILPSNNTWSAMFTFTDVNGNPVNVAGIQANLFFDYEDDCGWNNLGWWNYGIPLYGSTPSADIPYITASTTTGEIINGGTAGTLAVAKTLFQGAYRVRGETFIGTNLVSPFFSGRLNIGKGFSQLFVEPPTTTTAILWNDGGVVAITDNLSVTVSQSGIANLPTSPGSGEFWNDGGVVAINGTPAGFPTVLPSTPGIPWNNGGVLSIS